LLLFDLLLIVFDELLLVGKQFFEAQLGFCLGFLECVLFRFIIVKACRLTLFKRLSGL